MLYLEPRNLPEPLLGTLARNLGTFWNPLWLEPLLGTSEPAGTFTWNPYTWNLGTLLGTLTWNLGTCRNLYLEPLYLEPRNLRNLTWNPYLEPRNLPEPSLGTLLRNLGTCRNLYVEPLLGTSEPAGTFTWNPYLEPRNLPEPLLGTLTWNLGTCRNLYLEPLLGTSEPARTWRDDCPRVPQGLVWLGPQSFQLLGNKPMLNPNSCAISQAKPLGYPNWSGFIYTEFCKIPLKTFCLEPWNCMHPLLGTLTWHFGTFWKLHLKFA